jgi:hypothetical protein
MASHARRGEMKKLLLTGVAALLLATGAAQADSEKWEASFRQCHIRKWFSKDELANIGWARETEGQTIVIEAEEIPDILKAIRVIKKCKAFYQCLEDRDLGKVKHCAQQRLMRKKEINRSQCAAMCGGFVALTFAISVNDVAAQEVVTVCGPSAGYGYYLEPRQDGWVKDGISDGMFTVIRNATGDYGVITKDVQTTFSARGAGAKVVKVSGSDDLRFTLVVVYPNPITEIYQFSLDQRGRGTVLWAAVKNRVGLAAVTKGTLFTATCSK